MSLEDQIIDFIQQECDYLTVTEHDYWYLFNSCDEKDAKIVLWAIDNIKNSINTLKEIQNDCYHN